MKYYSDQFDQIEGLRSAVLTERCDGSPSEFSTEIDVGSDDGMAYMEPEALIHQGAVLFYGKGTSGSGSNRGGDAVLSATASDFRWMFDRQTLGSQLRELHLRSRMQRDLTGAANEALSDWNNLAESSRVEAAGWSCDEHGDPVEETHLGVDALLSGQYSTGSHTGKGTVMSIGFALRRMLRANPGTYLVPDYQAGTLRVMRYNDLPELVLDTRVHHILDISGITPNYESVPTGVAVVVEWPEKVGATGREELFSKLLTWPEDLDIDATGVRVFKTTAPNEASADLQAEHVMRQLRAWFEGASHVFCSGSVTLKMQDLAGSPLAHKLNIVGPGSIDTMSTPITSVEWDFLRQTVTLNLRGDIPEPRISTLPFPECQTESRSTTGGSGSWPSTTREKSSTTEETTGGDTTYTEPGSVSSTTLEPLTTTEGPFPPWSSTTASSSTAESTTGGTGTGTGTGCPCKRYEFDQEWFIVTETADVVSVGFRAEKIDAIVQELLAGVRVEVQVSGLVEHTEYGELKAGTTGDTNNGANTIVGYS